MATPSTLSQTLVEDNALSIPKSQRRPPALVLEEYNQEYSHVTVQAGAAEGTKPKQEYGMLRRLHNLLPMSYTPNSTAAPTAYYTASSDTPQVPPTADPKPETVPLRKVRSPRSASLPSIRWDKSPLSRRNTREGSSLAKVTTSEGAAPAPDPQLNVKGLKIRMITWNMHDSLPKGELEELLGKVLPYTPTPSCPAGTFPNLPIDPDHPYHFVVVAGQECPSVSGLPMAVGAGFKLREKEKEREDREKENAARGPSFEKDSDSRSSMQQGRSKDGTRSPDARKSEAYLVKPTITTLTDGRTPSPDPLQIVIPNPPLAGWTSVVEDWLCNGGIFELPKGPKTPKIVEVVGNVVTGSVPGTPRLALKRAPSIKEPKKGPYQFLVKERLMGIYLAIYVHRDLKPLIKGTSKSAVTAGLVGGRLGNKGGVGISVNLDGTTLLFLNCHLAAHEGKMHHRLANLAKIKSELEVDDFLPKDDPRKKLEDLTDRFDFTFLCGDLNFRLDITRLHADWLIARQDYAQALTFDQLLKAMKEGTQEFRGFHEAPINFPPTFKYDVLRTLKRQKRGDNEDDDDPDAEAMSISSVSTSFTRNTDLDLTNNGGYPSPATPAVPSSSSRLSLSQIVSAHKAKVRLLSLKSPFSALSSPSKTGRKRAGTAGTAETGYFAVPAVPASPANTAFPPTPKMIDHTVVVPPTPPPVDSTPLVPPPKVRVESMLSGVGSGSQDYFDGEKGVYDTSNKKRVPSWCDRILWKTTVERSTSPEPKPDHRQLLSPPPPKSTGGRIFARLRTRSARANRPPPLPAPRRQSSDEKRSTEFLPPLKTAPPLSQTIFTSSDEPGNGANNAPHAAQNASSAGAPQGNFFQRRGILSATVASPPGTAPAERPRRATGFGVLMSPLSGGTNNAEGGGTASRWRFLPNFLSPLSPHSHADAAVEEQVTPVVTPAIVHRRGDVICLDYNTLDDRQMRRLEGRSDHRPVLGTFVVYI